MEALVYLELQPGAHTFGVNSGASFRVTAGDVPTADTLGPDSFDEGRGDSRAAPPARWRSAPRKAGSIAAAAESTLVLFRSLRGVDCRAGGTESIANCRQSP